ncbi:hypothetical protein GCM10027176_51810 [Actinoallomurus bryophytorum]|uniref:MarR family protein n=1 Tax=Actinoallomurus bryophytorum TaxID=1490222 RepID=A0A543CHM1_9ACTN|nr:helix-turn-helix domain-containing protein [Actinoallomurus bryophytorum]TQL96581.1 MarR family protein [Actinoallomurus bryophytorum]
MATKEIATRTPADAAEETPGNGAEMAAATPGTATTTDAHPTPERVGGAVWYALSDHPGGTVATLAAESGVGKATARRVLNDLEKAGYAARTSGGHAGGKRNPDTWHPTTDATTDTTVGAVADEAPATPPPDRPSGTASGTIDDATSSDVTDEAVATDEADPQTGDGAGVNGPDGDEAEAAETLDLAMVADAREALSALADVIEAAGIALDSGDRTAALGAAETIYGDSARLRRLIKTATKHRVRSGSGQPHAHPGELRGKVAAHLAAHPGLQLTPHEVGKAIGHSAGAVANALDKLTETGQAVLTCDRPRRYTATAQSGAEARPAAVTA